MDEKWTALIEFAEKHSFLVKCYGGVAVVATIEKQEEYCLGIYCKGADDGEH